MNYGYPHGKKKRKKVVKKKKKKKTAREISQWTSFIVLPNY